MAPPVDMLVGGALRSAPRWDCAIGVAGAIGICIQVCT